MKVADREVGLREPADRSCALRAGIACRRLGRRWYGARPRKVCPERHTRMHHLASPAHPPPWPGQPFRGLECLPETRLNSNAARRPPQAARTPTSAPTSATFRTNSRLRPSRARWFRCARVSQRAITTGHTASEDETERRASCSTSAATPQPLPQPPPSARTSPPSAQRLSAASSTAARSGTRTTPSRPSARRSASWWAASPSTEHRWPTSARPCCGASSTCCTRRSSASTAPSIASCPR